MSKPPELMGGEELRREAKRIDRQLGYHLDRLRLSDPEFRAVLDRSLALESEIEKRKNP